VTTDVENYLGYPDGVGGMELIQRGKEQAEQFGAEFRHGSIESGELDKQPLELSISTSETLLTRALIVATGASARWVGAEGEDELMGMASRRVRPATARSTAVMMFSSSEAATVRWKRPSSSRSSPSQ
jgi:thioredoxin reductase